MDLNYKLHLNNKMDNNYVLHLNYKLLHSDYLLDCIIYCVYRSMTGAQHTAAGIQFNIMPSTRYCTVYNIIIVNY